MGAGRKTYRWCTQGWGDVFRSQDNLAAALENYRIALALAERLANADPANFAWQRELALSHGRIGMVLARQGSQRDAVAVLKQGHAILLRLRQQAPGDAALPTDLAWFEERMAELKK
jgi:hypothetical protein